jgi:predicted O-methyltransferase YrrM
MNIACFTMMKNEAAILGPFCDQLRTFFDYVLVADHGSVDGSADIIRSTVPRADVFFLESTGYPQSEIATFATRHIFKNLQADFLFYLDCDEFLPFANRQALEEALRLHQGDLLRLNWRNLCPRLLDGRAFRGGFLARDSLSEFPKVVVSRSFFEAQSTFLISQGYHTVAVGGAVPSSIPLSPLGLFHVPIGTARKYRMKMLSQSQAVRRSADLVAAGLGKHWLTHADHLQRSDVDDLAMRSLALNYPDVQTATPSHSPLSFDFPYVTSDYDDALLVEQPPGAVRSINGREFGLYDGAGRLIYASPAAALPLRRTSTMHFPNLAPTRRLEDLTTAATPSDEVARDYYDNLVAPLFSLPRKLPTTAWHGHIPFLFALFRMLRPRTYVDLGVHYGASLIAAATASTAYDTKTRLVGVDTWAGDEHAGRYDGSGIYQDLLSFVDRSFSDVHLLRTTFDDARSQFAKGSIDVLHIDGLHTYAAVKHDFEQWKDTVADGGVILFHDISVHERDFGVWQLWEELSAEHPHLTFTHCYGLGVLFPQGRHSLPAPIQMLLDNPGYFDSYRNLVSEIGELVPLRSAYLAAEEPAVVQGNLSAEPPAADEVQRELQSAKWAAQHYHNQLQQIRHEYESSRSWKITAPLRRLAIALRRR